MLNQYRKMDFRSTEQIIRNYGDPFKVDSLTDKKLKAFHYQKYQEYLKIMMTEYEKGCEELKDYHLQKA